MPPFIIATFDWRYELPQFSLIPVAAVLGLMAMTDRAGHAASLAHTSASLPSQHGQSLADESPTVPAEQEHRGHGRT